ncbi:retrovirus-related pol polyprotein from transposon TNT 1-94 [Tanacetum coccineum]
MEIKSLATKYSIVDWKTHVLTENFMYYQIFRANGSFKNYKIFSEMLDDFDRQDVLDLHRLVKARYMTSSSEGYDLMLWGDLNILFEPDEEDNVWRNQHYIIFDELTAMASEHSSSGPALHEMTPVSISSGLVPNPPSSTPFVPPSRSDWDLLFQPMFDESLNPPPYVDLQAPEVIAPIPEAVAPEHAVSTGSPSSTTVDQDAPSPSNSHTTQETQTPIISHDVEEDNHDIEVAHMDVIHTIVPPDHRVSEHNSKWTKDHPLENIVGALDRPVSTRLQLHEQALFCYYDAFLTLVEPKNYKDALTQACWIEGMQEELHEFERLEVWELVPPPDKAFVISLKWIYKVKLDELGGILKNKARLVARGYRQEEGIDFKESFAPFAKPSILGKPVLQPPRNQSVVRQPNAFKSERPNFSKPRFASQVDVNNVLSKPVTQHYLPKGRESAFAKPNHMIASSSSRNSSKNMPRFSSNDMVHNYYLEEAKKKTQERDRKSTTSVMPSAKSQNTTKSCKSKPRSNNQTSRVLPTSKSSCPTTTVMPKADHSRNSSPFSDFKHFVCSTCQKCVFNANHDACITKFLKEVNSRAKIQPNKTRNSNKPVDPTSHTQKPGRKIVTGHSFSPNKSSAVHEKTNTPRSYLRWIPTGRIFNTAGLKWVPTGKTFTSSTTKVDCELPNGSNDYITNPYKCDQTLNVSAGTLNLSADQHPCFMIMVSVDNTSGLASQRKEECTLQCALSSKEEKSSTSGIESGICGVGEGLGDGSD